MKYVFQTTLFAWLIWGFALANFSDEDKARTSREARGFSVEIDHDQRQIVVSTRFFAARRTEAEYRQLEAIVSFWERQSYRYAYRLGKGKNALEYPVVFDVQEAAGSYSGGGFFLPDPEENPAIMHQIQVVPSQVFSGENLEDEERRVVGYVQQNFVYIADDVAWQTWIGLHESGHCLGISHTAEGIMSEELHSMMYYLTPIAICQVLAGADIQADGYSQEQFPPKATEVQELGLPARGFWQGGKVVRTNRRAYLAVR
jgi:hypothetical protein